MLRTILLPRHSLKTLTQPSHNSLKFPIPSSFSSRHKKEDPLDDNFVYNRDPQSPPKLFVVQPRIRPDSVLQPKISEALNLANSLEEQRHGYFATQFCDKHLPPHLVVQNPAARSPKARADTYFGPGTVDTIKCHLNALDSEDELDAVFVNAILTGIQQRNLERAWGKPVLDRVGLIIEIFNAHAETKEGKLQAELAALMYKRTRLVRVRGPDGRYTFGAAGEAEVVSARGRGSGGRGFISGAGETELQLQRRRLFATVDPRLRSVILPSGRKVLLSDTVGFISDLPVQLVEAFHATLEEVVEADLLVHVLDSSAPNLDDQRATVLHVLEQIGVPEEKLQNMIEVWNKIDLQEEQMGVDYEYLDDGENDEDDSFSGAEDDVEPSELSSGNVEEETIDDQQEDDYSDGWLSLEAGEEITDDVGGSFIGRKALSDQPIESSMTRKDSSCETQHIPRVKTSAVMGVGLQEVLELIDEKLTTTHKVVERSDFDQKWRPPRTEDSGIAVEQ